MTTPHFVSSKCIIPNVVEGIDVCSWSRSNQQLASVAVTSIQNDATYHNILLTKPDMNSNVSKIFQMHFIDILSVSLST